MLCVDTKGASDKNHNIWTAGPYKENRDYANFKMASPRKDRPVLFENKCVKASKSMVSNAKNAKIKRSQKRFLYLNDVIVAALKPHICDSSLLQ